MSAASLILSFLPFGGSLGAEGFCWVVDGDIGVSAFAAGVGFCGGVAGDVSAFIASVLGSTGGFD